MVGVNKNAGFTIIEMLVSLVVMAIFLTLFFQSYSTNASQQLLVARRAAAFDVATSNLNKISSKIGLPACTDSANSMLNPSTEGHIIASNQPSRTPTWATASAIASSATSGIAVESLDGTKLPPNHTYQELRVVYPKGCDSRMPVTIVSVVRYGSAGVSVSNWESVRRAQYIN